MATYLLPTAGTERQFLLWVRAGTSPGSTSWVCDFCSRSKGPGHGRVIAAPSRCRLSLSRWLNLTGSEVGHSLFPRVCAAWGPHFDNRWDTWHLRSLPYIQRSSKMAAMTLPFTSALPTTHQPGVQQRLREGDRGHEQPTPYSAQNSTLCPIPLRKKAECDLRSLDIQWDTASAYH